MYQRLEAIRGVFLLCGMEPHYVPRLVQRHFDMTSNERLTDIGGNISEPITIKDDQTTYKGSLLSTIWVYNGDKLRPLELDPRSSSMT